MLIVLNFSKIYANDNFLSCLKNSKSNSQIELLIYYKSDCPHCIKMESEINKDINFQTKIKELYLIKLIDVSTIEGRKNAYINNVTSVPFIIKANLISNKKTIIKGFKSVEKLESDLTDQKYFSNNSVNAICGNGIIEAGEACDDGNLVNGDGCENNCTLTGAICGNGIIEAGEACDDGNLVNGDGCENNCTLTGAICGNGIIEAGETCDDGNLVNGDGCENNCTLTGAICGNGIIEAGEACDDGNLVNGDGCENNCTLTGAICGNGIIEAGETCDDGNLINGDGCDSNCTLTLGINENETKKKNVLIIPNPTKDFIQIRNNKLNSIESFEYKIFDLLGRVIKSGKSKYNEQINIESLTNGNYIIQIEIEKGEKSAEKLIKN